MRRTAAAGMALAAAVALLPAGGATAEIDLPVLFSPQGNQLDAYHLGDEHPAQSVFIPSASGGGKDLNGQVCPFPDGRHILLGKDSGQTIGVPQGWGVFDLETRREVGKLIAGYGTTPQPEPYGCAIETDAAGSVRRIFVGQVGEGSFTSADGQLIVFFPTSAALDAVFGRRTAEQVCPGGDCAALTKADSHWCVLDGDLRTAGGLAMDGAGNVYVAESAPSPPPNPAPGRILKYSPPFPSSPAECGTVAPSPSTFIQDVRSGTPAAIAAARDSNGAPTGHWYVSSVVFPPAVNEYDATGNFVRNIVPPGFGTPYGLTVGPEGTLYLADLGITVSPTGLADDPGRFGIGPGDGEGSVQRVRFAGGIPLPPEVLKDGLDFPDGLGILE